MVTGDEILPVLSKGFLKWNPTLQARIIISSFKQMPAKAFCLYGKYFEYNSSKIFDLAPVSYTLKNWDDRFRGFILGAVTLPFIRNNKFYRISGFGRQQP